MEWVKRKKGTEINSDINLILLDSLVQDIQQACGSHKFVNDGRDVSSEEFSCQVGILEAHLKLPISRGFIDHQVHQLIQHLSPCQAGARGGAGEKGTSQIIILH